MVRYVLFILRQSKKTIFNNLIIYVLFYINKEYNLAATHFVKAVSNTLLLSSLLNRPEFSFRFFEKLVFYHCLSRNWSLITSQNTSIKNNYHECT